MARAFGHMAEQCYHNFVEKQRSPSVGGGVGGIEQPIDRGSALKAGYDRLTPDQHAILDHAGPERLCLAAGHSGTASKAAPAMGAGGAEFVTEGRAKTADITLCCAEGRPPWANIRAENCGNVPGFPRPRIEF